MADTNKKAIGLEELSHFKAKQDLENLNKFQQKGTIDLTGAVRYDGVQVLTEEQQAQARANIGISEDGSSGGGSVEGAVRYDVEQALDDDDKARARENIGTTDGTWANMPDKPFGENGFAYELPIDTSQCVTISSQPLEILGGVAFTFVKVSDRLSSVNEIMGANVSAIANGSAIDFVVDESHIGEISNGFLIIYTNNAFLPACLNVTSVGTVTIPTAAMTNEDLVLNATEKGLYLLYMEGMGQVNSISKSEIKKIDAKYLPSYVDDVIEGYFNSEDNLFYEEAGFTTLIAGESGKIYLDVASNKSYRFGGTVFGAINPPEITFATTSDIDELFN